MQSCTARSVLLQKVVRPVTEGSADGADGRPTAGGMASRRDFSEGTFFSTS